MNEIEHRIFTPIVLTPTGGINKDCKIYHSRVAELIANKKEEQYHTTIAWKRAKIKFASPYSAICRSSLACSLGSRTLRITTNDTKNIDMDIEQKAQFCNFSGSAFSNRSKARGVFYFYLHIITNYYHYFNYYYCYYY